jgi:hypothetical protein
LDTQSLLALELSRLDTMHEKLWESFFEANNVRAVLPILGIMDRRIRLLGLSSTANRRAVTSNDANKLANPPHLSDAAMNYFRMEGTHNAICTDDDIQASERDAKKC